MSRLRSLRRNLPVTLTLGLVLGVGGVGGAAGAEPAAPVLSLDDALAAALRGSHRLQAAAARSDAAEAAVSEAASPRLPRVELHEGFSWTTNPVLVFSNLLGQENFTESNFRIDPLNRPDALTNFNTAVSVTWPVYSGGRIDGGLDAARAERDATDAGGERTRQEVVRDVVEAYSAAVLAEAQLRVARESLETARANVRLVADLHESGLVVRSDLLQARVRESEVEEMVIRAESAVQVARASLNLALGRDLDTPFALPDDLAAAGGPDEPLETLIARATGSRPDLRAAEARVRAAEHAVRVERAGRRPEIGVGGRVEANAEDFVGADGSNWSVFLGVRLPLFEGGRNRARIAAAEAHAREARSRADLLRLSAELDTRRAYHEVRAAAKSLEQSRSAVELAGESLRIVQDRYREGLTTLVDLLEAETFLTRARAREVATTRALIVSQADLRLAVGLP